MMKRKTIYFCTLAALMMLPACNNNDEVPAIPAEKETVMLSGTVSRADGSGIPAGHQAKLYVAERKAEDPQEELYCNRVEDITGGTYSLTDMLAQWYKLAFVSAPISVTLPGVPAENAFNSLIVNYSPVLKKQNQSKDEDFAIYRANIDRWLMPDKPLTENVTMKRITGQLVLDMGVLEDQFPVDKTNHELPTTVSEITISLTNVPAQVYIHDNANGSVITTDEKAFTYNFTEFDRTSDNHFCMYFNLLPHTVSGTVSVTYTAESGSEVTVIYPLVTTQTTEDEKNESVEIKPNVKTTVYFNGMENGEFEVRYAGFEGTEIDVEEDWNGWN